MTPSEILDRLLIRATEGIAHPIITDQAIFARVEFVCRTITNRACTRLLMAAMLAKLDDATVDVRKPYTEIDSEDSFSGRTYDERYITRFAASNRLPVNSTTAFLTPAFRNINQALTVDLEIIGRPRELYCDTLQLLDDVQTSRISAEDLLTEIIRILVVMRQEAAARMETLLAGLKDPADAMPLSSEEIVRLISQHLQCKNASRLPVLIVAAAYNSVAGKLGERVLALNSHNAADKQTGALGDVEICLENEDRVVTVYEMKDKRITLDDIDGALQKIASAPGKIDNYLFVTTDMIDEAVLAYAVEAYERTFGTEIAILDCLGFLRHFLHLFHRARIKFLTSYQALVLAEPDSAVSQPLKEAFLALRQAAEIDQ